VPNVARFDAPDLSGRVLRGVVRSAGPAGRCWRPLVGFLGLRAGARAERTLDLDDARQFGSGAGRVVPLSDGGFGYGTDWGVWGAPAAGRVSAGDTVSLGGSDLLELNRGVVDFAFRPDGGLWEITNPAGSPPKLGSRDAAGFLDVSFGRDGTMAVEGEPFPGTAILADGQGRPILLQVGPGESYLRRLTLDGAPDPSFNGGELLPVGTGSWPHLFPDRERVLLISFDDPSALGYIVVDQDGAIDASFPPGEVDLGDMSLVDVAVEGDRLLVLAEVLDATEGGGPAVRSWLIPVQSTGDVGEAIPLDVPSQATPFFAQSLAPDGAGDILVAGVLDGQPGWTMRLRPDLSVDACFGAAGDGMPTGVPYPGGAAALADGTVVVSSVDSLRFVMFAPGSP
jgi:hypothetical protein